MYFAVIFDSIPIAEKKHVLLKKTELWDRWIIPHIQKNTPHIANVAILNFVKLHPLTYHSKVSQIVDQNDMAIY